MKQLNIPIYAVDRQGGRLHRQRSFNRIVREVQPRYLHSYNFYTNFPTWLAARAVGVESALGSLQSNYWNEVEQVGPLFGRLCASLPRFVIANSKAAADSVSNHRTIFRPHQVWVVSNGVDTELFAPKESRINIGDRLELLGVGSLTSPKRWEWLLSLMGGLQRLGKVPDWHLTICGEGEEYTRLQDQIHELGLETRVTLAGYQRDVVGWMQKSDVLLLSSLFEGTPNVVAEALSCGLPVISTDVGDVRELIRDGVDGYIVALNDRETYQNRLLELMTNTNLRQQMGQNGRSWMLQTRSPRSLVENTLAVYRAAGWKIE